MTDTNKEAKQVIVVRKDLNMRKGKIAAQAAHASMAHMSRSLRALMQLNPKPLAKLMFNPAWRDWVNGKFAKITVYVESEEELLEIHKQAQEAGLIATLIQDEGRTEFKGVKTYTTVAVGPGYIPDVDKVTKGLKLL